MLLFRSEEHRDRWLESRDFSTDGSISLDTMWELARAWYHDRFDPRWRRKTVDEANAVFADLGLTGPFWRL